MVKMDGGCFDEVATNIAAIGNLFPQAVSEGKIDFETLKGCLGAAVEERKDFYRLLWNGKEEARAFSRVRSQATLRPCPEESKEWTTTQNLYIEGDNLEVLKLLQGAYHNSVKMIYIDPPYNTGKDFVYRDNFHDSVENYKQQTGQVDAEGRRTSTNSETSGRYHTNWLNMIFPRLLVARNLLRDDGVIFISIDDNEVSNLRKVCDEVFGEDNFVAQIVWQKKYAATNDSKGFSTTHDYVVAYQKQAFERNLLPRTAEQNAPYKNDDGDGKGLWRSDNLLVRSFSESGVYPITNPNTGKEYYPPKGSCWRASKETMSKWISENRIYFGKDGNGAPQLKRYLNEVQQGRVPITWWPFDEVGHNDEANKEMHALFGAKTPFDTPKPTRLLLQMLRIGTGKDDVILDFFSGSATTAHAVMQLNAEDGGARRFICVQLPEICSEGSEAEKAGFKTICEIGKERIRRAGEKVMSEWRAKKDAEDSELKFDGAAKAASVQPDIGFRVFKLDTSNIAAWNPKTSNIEQELINAEDNILAGRTRDDLLYEILLKSNVMLTAKVEEKPVAGRTIYVADGGKLMACLDDKISVDVADEMVRLWKVADAPEHVPPVVVFRETGFASDEDKANALTTLMSAGIETVRTI